MSGRVGCRKRLVIGGFYSLCKPAGPPAGSAAGQQALQIFAVFALLDGLDQAREGAVVDEALAPGDLLRAADLQTLPILDRLDELRRAQQAGGRAGVEPGVAAAELLDREPPFFQVVRVDIRDLELAARRTRDRRG